MGAGGGRENEADPGVRSRDGDEVGGELLPEERDRPRHDTGPRGDPREDADPESLREAPRLGCNPFEFHRLQKSGAGPSIGVDS